jgi:hypothetical protein
MYKATQEIKFGAFNILFPWYQLAWCGHTIRHCAGVTLAISSPSTELVIPVHKPEILHIMLPSYSGNSKSKSFIVDFSDACKP